MQFWYIMTELTEIKAQWQCEREERDFLRIQGKKWGVGWGGEHSPERGWSSWEDGMAACLCAGENDTEGLFFFQA